MKTKFSLFLFLSLFFVNTNATIECQDKNNLYSELSNKEETIQKQTVDIHNFLKENLPKAQLKQGYETEFEIVGKTDKGKRCAIRNTSTNGYIFLVFTDHPRLPKNNETYNQVSFSWDHNEMTNILGFEVKPNFSISDDHLDAKVTIAAGFGIAKNHLIVKKEDGMVKLKIRNRESILNNFLECNFKRE